MEYADFLKSKIKLAESYGFDCSADEVNPACKPHQVDTIVWNVQGGRRGNFSAFGLGKTIEELEIARLVNLKAETILGRPGRSLIVMPLGVRQEFARDAVEVLGWPEPPRFIRRLSECPEQPAEGPAADIYLSNYESIRDGRLDPAAFDCVILDEASCLRGFGGTKTFREMMYLCTGDGGPSGRSREARVRWRFVATATPSPNDYIELLAYSAFLGIMDVSQAKTRFFKRDSTKADHLRLHPHKEREFWLWVSSWALFVTRPSDLGHDDAGYTLPEMEVHWHEVGSDHSQAGTDRNGQGRLFVEAAIGVQEAAAEKRRSLPARIEKLLELRRLDPGAHRIIWHDLEAERRAIEQAVPSVVSVWGSQEMEERERRIMGFSRGEFQELATKPVIAGSGCNFQRHCAWAIFLGIGFKFNDFIQAVHRIHRFLQTRRVRIDLIYTEAEREVRRQLERKWQQHERMVARMTEIVREYGLSLAAMAGHLERKLGVERVVCEDPGGRYRLACNDCVDETGRMETDSVDLVLTSIPFSTQYEYSPNYADFGHSEGNDEFFEQMDYLTPELARVTRPGRIVAVHVKDRIVPGGMTGLGFQTVYPFHARCIEHYTGHGLAYMGMVTVVTDVVRENNQTYRLGWTEQCKDATKMGVGMPEYLLLFRVPPSETENSYADTPVVKDKGDYTRSRWQVDAHAFWRSSGNRHLAPEELHGVPHATMFKLFRSYSLQRVYDYEHHVRLCESLEATGRLPTTFMLLQPQSWAPEVWSDITRMRTMNTLASQQGRRMHLCPLQFDLVDRVIRRFSMPGEVVYDPFAGVATVPARAVKLGRVGWGCELNGDYWSDGCTYCRAEADRAEMPSLFDAVDTDVPAKTAGVMGA